MFSSVREFAEVLGSPYVCCWSPLYTWQATDEGKTKAIKGLPGWVVGSEWSEVWRSSV